MIIDSHTHIFQHWAGGACGHATRGAHINYLRKIGTGVSYEALHLCTLGRRYGYKDGDFPVTERIARETVALPLHAGMTIADVDRVCDAAADVFARARS